MVPVASGWDVGRAAAQSRLPGAAAVPQLTLTGT